MALPSKRPGRKSMSDRIAEQEARSANKATGATPARKSKLNSAVTNHTRLFLQGRESSAVARLIRDNISIILADLGGAEQCSKMEQSLARRVAVLDAVCVGMEGKFVETGDLDTGLYVTATNSLNRVASTLGLARRPRDVTPSLEAYLASRPASRPEKQDEDDGDDEGGDDG